MEPIGCILASLSIAGGILNAYKKIICFPIWLIANLGWMIYDIHHGLWAQATLFAIYSLTCFYGTYQWSKDGKRRRLRAANK